MNVETVKEILILVAPTIATLATVISGIVYVLKSCKRSEAKQLANLMKETKKMNKSFDDIAVIKAKLASIEKHLADKEKM